MKFYAIYDGGNLEYTGQYFKSQKKAQNVATASNDEASEGYWECDDFIVEELNLNEED